MAATDPSARTSRSAGDDSGVGIAHPTVVPTNFDPADSSDE
jgi:hypothetical protein